MTVSTKPKDKTGENTGKDKTEVEVVEDSIEKLEGRHLKYDSHRNEPGQRSYQKNDKHLTEPGKDHVWGFRPTKHGEAAKKKKKAAQAEHHENRSHHANHNTVNIPGFTDQKK